MNTERKKIEDIIDEDDFSMFEYGIKGINNREERREKRARRTRSDADELIREINKNQQ